MTSSWGNGHATTYRALLGGLAARGHKVTFFEADVPWYAANRDLPEPPFAELVLYESLRALRERHADAIRDADVVVIGSYVQEGIEVARWLLETARGPVLFYDIDTPVTVADVERGRCTYLTRDLVPHFHAYLSFTGGPILDRIEQGLGARRAVPLYCAVDPAAYPAPTQREESYDLGYLGTYSADRQPSLQRFLVAPARLRKARRFIVAGPKYPSSVAWPANVERREHVAPTDHPRFYQAQRFTLNVTRAEMVRSGYAPSVRLFEAAATATPIITDMWLGLDTLFEPGKEILPVWGTRDVLRCLDMIEDAERRQIGRRARQRVLLSHTPAHRAREFEAVAMPLVEGRLAHA